MKQKNIQCGSKTQKTADKKSILTKREQEIFELLLNGICPKEIAHSLKIKVPTVIYHQYNMYKKLGVHSIKELLVKYLREPLFNDADEITPVFTSLGPLTDDYGSSISISKGIKKIKDQKCFCYAIKGKLAADGISYAGIHCFPDSPTLEVMKEMISFSFKVLGDGNSYEIAIITTDTRKKGGCNHYQKQFNTIKNKISIIQIKVSELAQVNVFNKPVFGKSVKFMQSNSELIQLHINGNGDFNLKFWDIKFFL